MSMMEPGPEMPAHVHVIAVDAAFVLEHPTIEEAAKAAFVELCIFGQRLTFTPGGTDRPARITCVGGCENLPRS
ncbi:MAG: hypothetical protein ACEQSX_08010 [Baekduiaceae bacterium]